MMIQKKKGRSSNVTEQIEKKTKHKHWNLILSLSNIQSEENSKKSRKFILTVEVQADCSTRFAQFILGRDLVLARVLKRDVVHLKRCAVQFAIVLHFELKIREGGKLKLITELNSSPRFLIIHLMPRGVVDHFAVVGPPNLGLRIRLDLALEDQPLAVVLLLDRGLLDEGRCETIDLSVYNQKIILVPFVFFNKLFRTKNYKQFKLIQDFHKLNTQKQRPQYAPFSLFDPFFVFYKNIQNSISSGFKASGKGWKHGKQQINSVKRGKFQ